MTRKLVFVLLFSSLILTGCQVGPQKDNWQSLFDGKTLNGWKASENKDTFSVKDGMIVVDGPRSHLFYVGPYNGANFKDFEFKADVMTKPGSNSGIYFHTKYQDTGWPAQGFECQVNSTHRDRKKTGGLYAVEDVMDNAPSTDDKWFNYYIRVDGKRVIIKIDGETTVDWTQPDDWDREDRRIGEGTIALQGHDPKSVIYYKNIMVRVPPAPMD